MSRGRKVGCILLPLFFATIGPPGCIAWPMLYRTQMGKRDASQMVERLRKSLAKDAEGENQLHAWTTRFVEMEAGRFDWVRDEGTEAFRQDFDRTQTQEDRDRLARALPLPWPPVVEELLAWGGVCRLTVWRGTYAETGKPGVAIRLFCRASRFPAYVSLSLSEEYLNSAPPLASVFRDTPSRQTEDNRQFVPFSPGFSIGYGVVSR
jgi:hypothetical protein